MGVITNIISTVFTSTGGDRVNAEMHSLGRSQTRLGQSSAGAGRQFAAQASGLGGLVAAYAGAAATSFALTAAFDSLARSARAIQTIEGVNTLAAGYAQSGDKILKSVQAITQGQLTLVEAAEQASLGLSAGFKSDQINDLALVSLKASRALGRDLTDAMTRVVRGSAKMETELLDELGIYTKIEPATRAYAAAIGKTVGQLSEYERRQAFVNAVIAEGQRKFSAINTTIPTAAQQIESLGTKLSDMATQLGGFLAEMLAPLAGGVVDNVAAAFGTLGVVLSLIAAKGVQLFKASMDSLIQSMTESGRRSENYWRAKLRITDAVMAATSATETLTASTLRLSAAEAASFTKLQGIAATRALTRKELRDSNKLLTNNLGLLKAEKTQLVANATAARNSYSVISDARKAAVDAQRKAIQDTAAARAVPRGTAQENQVRAANIVAARRIERDAQTAARNANAAQTAARMSMQTQLIATNMAMKQTNIDIKNTESAINANAKAIDGWRSRLAAFAGVVKAPFVNAASSIGTVMGGVIGLASKIFFLVSMFQLLGTAIANAMGKGDEFNAYFSDLGKSIAGLFNNAKAKTTKNAILGVTAGVLSDLERLDNTLRNTESFSFKKKSFFGVDIEITKTKEQLVKEVSDILYEAGQEGGKSLGESMTSATAMSLAGVGAAIGAFFSPIGLAAGAAIGYGIGTWLDYLSPDDMDAAITKYGTGIKERLGAKISTLSEDIQDETIKALAVIQEKYSALALIDPAARAAKNLQEQLTLDSAGSLRTIEAISRTMAATTKSAEEVNKVFKFKTASDGISNINEQLSYVSEALTTIGNQTVNFLFIDDMDQQFQKAMTSAIDLGSAIENSIAIKKLKLDPNDLKAAAANLGERVNLALKDGINITDIMNSLSKGYDPRSAESITGTEKQLYKTLGTDLAYYANTLDLLKTKYQQLAGATNEAQSSAMMVTNILRDNSDAYAQGSLTLEKFTENLDSSRSGLIASSKALTEAKIKQAEFEAVVKSIPENSAARKSAESVLSAQKEQVDVLERSIEINRSILREQLLQEESIRKQIELITFLKDQGKGVMSDLDFQFELVKTGTENATQASIDFFAAQIEGNKTASKAASDYRSELEAAMATNPDFKLLVGADAIAAMTTTSIENMSQLNDALQEVPANLAYVHDGILYINDDINKSNNAGIALVEQSSQNALDIVEYSSDALKKLGQDTAIEITKLAFKFGNTIATAISEVDSQLSALAQNSTLEKLQFSIDMADIAAQGAQAAFEFEQAFKENQIKIIELEVDLKKKTPVSGAEEINTLQADILNIRTTALVFEKLAADIRYQQERALLDEKLKAEESRIDLEAQATKSKLQAEYDVLKSAVQTYFNISSQLETAIVTGGNTMGETIVAAINSGIQAFTGSFGTLGKMLGLDPKKATFVASPTPGTKQRSLPSGGTISEFELAQGRIIGKMGELDGSFNATIASIDMLTEEQKRYAQESVERERSMLETKYQQELLAIERNAKLNEQQKEVEKLNAEKRLKDALESGGGEDKLTEIEKKLQALFDSIKGHIETAIMGLNNLIFYGEGNFGDIMGNLFKSIQQDFFKQTVADPLSNMLTTSIFGSLGVGVTKGEKGLTFNTSDNSLLVRVVNASEFGLGGALGGATDPNNPEATGVVGWMSKLFGKDGTVSGFFSNLFGEGGILSNLLGGFGSFLGSIFKAIFGGIFGGGGMFGGGKVTGGIMHMAQGGVAGSSALRRDRIPALLEPGEFVVRKPVARMVGTPALNSLNATGRMPNGGAPTINIVNEGSPKDVQQAKPRFDGEKYVIDIILRDLSNNGPIRRSLRGGSS